MTGLGLVIDASVAIAIMRREQDAPALTRIVREWAARGDQLVVPDHFWLELVNVLIRRYRLSPEQTVERLRDVAEFELLTIRIERPLLLLAIEMSFGFGLSTYDAAYLALAETEHAQLLTLDRRLSRAAGTRAVRVPGRDERRLSEEPEPYGGPIDWARFGPYLAQLRAEARAIRQPT